jgi:tetraacyldisaccharide-1-P 4'-kinase
MGSDGHEVGIWIHCLLRCEHGAAALLVRHDAEELAAFLSRMEVEVVALDDGFTVSRLKRGVTE